MDSIIILLVRTFARIPLRITQSIGRGAGLLVYGLSKKNRQRLQDNARQAGHHDRAFFHEAAKQSGAMFTEIPRVWLHYEDCLSRVQVANPELLQQARAESQSQSRGILFITPHLGAFELCARFLAQQKPITVLFKPPRKQVLTSVTNMGRGIPNLNAVPVDRNGLRVFMQTLKQGGDVGLLPDQTPSSGGMWVPWFDRLAYTMTFTGKVLSSTNPFVMMVACERLAKGQGWRLHFRRGPELAHEPLHEQLRQINAAMQELINIVPEQYLWSYHRYKEPSAAPDPINVTFPPS